MKRLIILYIAVLWAFVSLAQTDVTKYFMTNYGFDSGFNYTASSNATVTQEINKIKGWAPNLEADYTITGVYEFGFQGKYNGATVPAKGYDNESGGGLALSTGWSKKFCYSQAVTLPKGTYTIQVPTYNGKTVTAGVSQLAWIPASGEKVSSSLNSYPSQKWTVDEITFTLSQETQGEIQIGYQATSGGSVNSANLLIDYVRILGKDMEVSTELIQTAVNEAQKYYKPDAIDADVLKQVMDEAQADLGKSESMTATDVLDISYRLRQSLQEYRLKNLSEDNPIDYTEYIKNPSFEVNGTASWTVKGMSTQTNAAFTKKEGKVYMQAWVNRGTKIGNASLSQTIVDLPRGTYKLSAPALHIQQSGQGSIVNTGNPQTGACLFAENSMAEITSMDDYSVKFSVFDEEADVNVGVKAENATGNYLAVDNFTLSYIGLISKESYLQEIETLVDRANDYLSKGIQNSVAEELSLAIEKGKNVKQTDDETLLDEVRVQLLNALSDAKASQSLYISLQTRIDYAKKVLGWWKNDTRKASAVSNLTSAIASSQEQMSDYSLTTDELTQAVKNLNAKIQEVDKKIYCSSNACGSDSKLQNSDNQWCYQRSLQSKHWILFWEKDYGEEVPSAVQTILNSADKIFECYANELKFLTINQGTSKTDTYKMIIRLRYTTEWEASGSGIDDKIGMLTLSRNAYTSRSGQTLAHEIGHCFQYQTHCDNNDKNGWMYTWENSNNGNVFWEMCAQWQAYKFYPKMQFNNEWFSGSINNFHRHPLSEQKRYNSYFVQDFFCHKHGMDAIGTLWNKSKKPEDPFQAYMRIYMDESKTAAQKLELFNDEMWEYGARLTTFDMDDIRDTGASSIGKRSQTQLTKDDQGFWCSNKADCIENFGNNAIRLNIPSSSVAKKVYAELVGEAGKDGFIAYNVTKAGWKFGFVALRKDGTRVYGDVTTTRYDDPKGVAEFECPADCSYLWLVVSGAPTEYWSRGWNGDTSDDEQWPYKVKFYQTNVYGNTNNDEVPTSIHGLVLDEDFTNFDYITKETIKKEYKNSTLYLHRSLLKEKWNTIVLPVSLTASQFEETFGAKTKLARFNGVRNNRLQFVIMENTDGNEVLLNANIPYIIYPTKEAANKDAYSYTTTSGEDSGDQSSNSYTVTVGTPYYVINNVSMDKANVNDIVINGTETANTLKDGYAFNGILVRDYDDDSSFIGGYPHVKAGDYTFNQGQLHQFLNDYGMKGFRCWFSATDDGNVQAKPMGVDINGISGDVTKIDMIFGVGDFSEQDAIYNLNGQKVNALKIEDLPCGIYIVNHKKYVVK